MTSNALLACNGRSFRLEIHRHAVDAVALMGRRGTVREDMDRDEAGCNGTSVRTMRMSDRRFSTAPCRIVKLGQPCAFELLSSREQFWRNRAGKRPGAFSNSSAQLPGASVPMLVAMM